MITIEKLKTANTDLDSIPQKNKNYVMVNTRVKAFRSVEPNGCIETEFIMLDFDKGVAVCRAVIFDEEGKAVASGTAYEKEGSNFVNKTSFIENCETSAVGRALGFLGIGIDDSMASADEVANAIVQQKDKEPATESEKAAFIKLCEERDVDPEMILKQVGWKSGKLTKEIHGKAVRLLING